MENKKKIKKAKKILFITPRNPFSGRYSGDVIRAKKISQYLKKKFWLFISSFFKFFFSNNKKKGNKTKNPTKNLTELNK